MSTSNTELPFVLPLTDPRATDISLVGGKGTNLARLIRAEFPVPKGFVVTTAAYNALLTESDIPDRIRALESLDPQNTEAIAEAGGALRDAIQSLSVPSEVRTAIEDAVADTGVDTAYAARSSATAEDLPSASFAGQHETLLNVQGEDEAVEAVRTCMASLFTDRAITYRARNDIPHDQVALAVVVQEMTNPDASGILFTADPTTGERNVAVIDAGFGLGEAQVGGAVTGDHARIDKATKDILRYDIGDKPVAVQPTSSGGTKTVELPANQRTGRVLTDDQVRALASIADDVEELFGTPQDIEWALVDDEVVLLQSRPITTLPEQPVASASEWMVPDPNLAYARVGPAELLPDPLSPLFESLGGPIMTESSVEMAREFLGTDAFSKETYAFTTVNGYAYYSVSLAPKFLLRLSGRGVLAIPKILGDVGSDWRETVRPQYVQTVEAWEKKDAKELQAAELLSGVETILRGAINYYNSSRFVLLRVRQNEALFTTFYERFVKRSDDPPSQTFLLGFDSEPIRAEKALSDIATWCRENPALVDILRDTPRNDAEKSLTEETPPDSVSANVWTEWQTQFQAYLDEHGHAIYDLDILKPVPATDPSLPFDTLTWLLESEGLDPYERQHQLSERRQQATDRVLRRLGPIRRPIFRRLLRQAQNVTTLREDILAEVGSGWPVLQQMAEEVGRRLADADAIDRAEDVYWLEWGELNEMSLALDAGKAPLDDVTETVEERKATWESRRRLNPPDTLPDRIRFLGFSFETERFQQRDDESSANVISGAGTSPGHVTGRACVIHGPEDFGKFRADDVLVARMTAPAWTSLFTKASAVVTDIGGPLSHGSIVAREYDIPAVLGTGVATDRIRDGQLIRVDGDSGTVTLLDYTK